MGEAYRKRGNVNFCFFNAAVIKYTVKTLRTSVHRGCLFLLLCWGLAGSILQMGEFSLPLDVTLGTSLL